MAYYIDIYAQIPNRPALLRNTIEKAMSGWKMCQTCIGHHVGKILRIYGHSYLPSGEFSLRSVMSQKNQSLMTTIHEMALLM